MLSLLRFPAKESEAIYREKGSRFMAFLFIVQTDEEVKKIVQRLRLEHPQAVHVCTGWHLHTHGEQGKSSDDGEPSGSAGRPILNKIYSHSVKNVLIAVVRYYGGIKLGVPGLINAYKTVAEEALNLAGIEEKEAQFALEFEFDYAYEGEMNSLIKKHRGIIKTKEYSTNVQWVVLFPLSEYENLQIPYGVVSKSFE